jgi:hypothetical protein
LQIRKSQNTGSAGLLLFSSQPNITANKKPKGNFRAYKRKEGIKCSPFCRRKGYVNKNPTNKQKFSNKNERMIKREKRGDEKPVYFFVHRDIIMMFILGISDPLKLRPNNIREILFQLILMVINHISTKESVCKGNMLWLPDHFSSKRRDVQERRDDNSSCVANPKPCHLILPNLSSRKVYLQRENVNKWQLLNKNNFKLGNHNLLYPVRRLRIFSSFRK